jgi:hypothetical protein
MQMSVTSADNRAVGVPLAASPARVSRFAVAHDILRFVAVEEHRSVSLSDFIRLRKTVVVLTSHDRRGGAGRPIVEYLDMPKSTTFTALPADMKMLAGLISRWTSPLE